jgi:hypothetical protein
VWGAAAVAWGIIFSVVGKSAEPRVMASSSTQASIALEIE